MFFPPFYFLAQAWWCCFLSSYCIPIIALSLFFFIYIYIYLYCIYNMYTCCKCYYSVGLVLLFIRLVLLARVRNPILIALTIIAEITRMIFLWDTLCPSDRAFRRTVNAINTVLLIMHRISSFPLRVFYAIHWVTFRASIMSLNRDTVYQIFCTRVYVCCCVCACVSIIYIYMYFVHIELLRINLHIIMHNKSDVYVMLILQAASAQR